MINCLIVVCCALDLAIDSFSCRYWFNFWSFCNVNFCSLFVNEKMGFFMFFWYCLFAFCFCFVGRGVVVFVVGIVGVVVFVVVVSCLINCLFNCLFTCLILAKHLYKGGYKVVVLMCVQKHTENCTEAFFCANRYGRNSEGSFWSYSASFRQLRVRNSFSFAKSVRNHS